jgi:biotin carboxyl carrier protein
VSEHEAPEVRALGGGRFEIVSGNRRQLAWAVRGERGAWVFLDGRSHIVTERGARPGTRVSHDDPAALSAPMPATVVSVHVAAGDAVHAGDLLVTLEAMKMELAIRSPRDGSVRRVACKPGELVQPGIPLVELD